MPPRLTGILETVLYYEAGQEEELHRFYGEVLGLPRAGRIGYRVGAGVLLLFDPDESSVQDEPPPHGARGPAHTCFICPPGEYDAWKKHLAEAGVELRQEIAWGSGPRSFYFDDPAGNVLEIAEGDIWPGAEA